MNKIEAFIRPEKLDNVKDALANEGIMGVDRHPDNRSRSPDGRNIQWQRDPEARNKYASPIEARGSGQRRRYSEGY